MSVYLEVARKSFQRHLAYRAANLAGILTNTFFGAVYVFIYLALLQPGQAVGGLDARDAVTYVVLTQSLLMVMSAFGQRELSQAIISGDVASDLSRPVDFYGFWAALDLGRSVYYLLFRGIPTFVIGFLLFHARPPASGGAFLLFVASVAVGMVVSFTFRFIASSLAFWTTDARGINYLTSTVILFFSGFIVPLNFFPGWLRQIVEWFPFRSLAHLPVSIYLGKADSAELVRSLVLSAAWLVVLVGLGRGMLVYLVRQLSIHGG